MTKERGTRGRTPEEIEMAEMLRSMAASHEATAAGREARKVEEVARQRKEAEAYAAMIASADRPADEEEQP